MRAGRTNIRTFRGYDEEITELNSGLASTLSIGTVTTSGATLLPELINRHIFYWKYRYFCVEVNTRIGRGILGKDTEE